MLFPFVYSPNSKFPCGEALLDLPEFQLDEGKALLLNIGMAQPNILLITTDQQRGDCLGINGNRFLETPNLDSLAANGTNFSRGYVTCPVCIPARRTLLSGMSPTTHGLRSYRDGQDLRPEAFGIS